MSVVARTIYEIDAGHNSLTVQQEGEYVIISRDGQVINLPLYAVNDLVIALGMI